MTGLKDALSSRDNVTRAALRRPVKGYVLYVLGGIVYAISMIFMVLCLLPFGLITPFRLFAYIYILEIWRWNTLWIVPGSGIVWLLLAGYGRELIARGRGYRAVLALDVLKGDSRQPVIYLRSFKHDGIMNRQPGVGLLDTLEEQLNFAIRHYGPFLAFGRPEEEFPTPGAARLYYRNDEWRPKMEVLLEAVQAVIMVAADETPGMRWELETIVRVFDPEKLLIFLPLPLVSKKETDWQSGYAAYHRWADAILPRGLPAQSANAVFIAFDADWNPRLIERRKKNLLTGLLRPSMEEVPGEIRAIVQEIHRDRSFLVDRKKSGVFTAESAEQIAAYSYVASLLAVGIASYRRVGTIGWLAPIILTAVTLGAVKIWDWCRHRATVRARLRHTANGSRLLG